MKLFGVIHDCFVTDHIESTTHLVWADSREDALRRFTEIATQKIKEGPAYIFQPWLDGHKHIYEDHAKILNPDLVVTIPIKELYGGHHVWCNNGVGSAKDCRYCAGPEGAWAMYPYESFSDMSNLASKHFPDAQIVPGTASYEKLGLVATNHPYGMGGPCRVTTRDRDDNEIEPTCVISGKPAHLCSGTDGYQPVKEE